MKITVIIPSYKPSSYINDCLDSLVNQTLPKDYWEIILVLNGCNEPYCSKILNRYSINLPNLSIIQTDNAGVSNARNIGISESKGEYITFIDDDDFVSPSYLEELYAKATVDTIPVCYPLSFVDGTMNYLPYHITSDYIKNAHKGKCDFKNARKFFSGPVYKLINRQVIGDRRFDKRFHNGEDSLFMFLISDKFRYVDFTSINAVYYRRIRKGSAVNRKRSRLDIICNEIKLIREYTKIYLKTPMHYSFQFYFTRILGAMRNLIN